MIRVLLADDEVLVRAGVRAILGADPELSVVAEAADGREAIDLALKHRPDVVLVDVRMPRLDGLEAARELARLGFGVAMLTTFNDDGYLERALDGGARGFLLKSGDPRELIAGVHALASGGAYLAPKVAARMITRFRGGRVGHARTQVESLTARERDVLALLGEGLSNAQIARRLQLVEGTVKGHVSAILGRLGAENRVQAAIVAHEAGLSS
ncbi:response regulator [Lentzea flaviverrucosa]|uniref:DNA-binding response regulator, NarL/FixJ family, contains REC and HTH domains n=1 Tax=Lentzea flaviverrucosa TaxID=200379 RepID=A0A1H9FXI2_9PSEU|nr:response regulator transcription factor [Lentzea flaviverrucosa]RDI35074.1 LuxR family two component transcriptional regulator [Lentzea flaviverrucosa]SEQ42557.1 DNA-binding response regulator, NarL/FixJ family, contains REC and HTH domains [Lentzea flaviverrucosa]